VRGSIGSNTDYDVIDLFVAVLVLGNIYNRGSKVPAQGFGNLFLAVLAFAHSNHIGVRPSILQEQTKVRSISRIPHTRRFDGERPAPNATDADLGTSAAHLARILLSRRE
jgi:hypothetical protein